MEKIDKRLPRISIIVPVYNVEQYLKKCINSILAQTFTDFELILVDDGSPDNCGVICDEYVVKDSRIRVIHKENGGLSSARNAGMAIAAGAYYLFCDSDDYVAPTWCEHFMECVKPTMDNFIFGGFITARVQADSTILDDSNTLRKKTTYPVSDFLRLQVNAQIGFACNVLYYADILRDNDLHFSSDVIVEDLPFNLAYLKFMKELTGTGAAEYFYVQDERQTLSRKYYPHSFRRWQEKYQATVDYIDTEIAQCEQAELKRIVATKYLYPFLQSLNNTFDARNTQGYFQKLKYNASVVNNESFQHCLHHADCKNEDQRYIALLKQRKYMLAYILQRAARMKAIALNTIKR